eukprot:TRINITY_DN2362_c0_g2_i1.p1 TRINITY_DN2362_c0_g2~~TRINITY_DN2362_c0_g2_i1.p1  ORF type:complete len:1131 (+),score=226.81 TRINITY_DN2362_c0_g2_i1:60-3452(+)
MATSLGSPFLFGIFLLLLSVVSSVDSSVKDDSVVIITPTWNVTRTQLDNFVKSLNKLDKDTWGWHWGPNKDCSRWVNQGHIDQGELDFLNAGNGARGGGFYVSFSTSDSRSYGPDPVGLFFPKGTLQLTLDNQEAFKSLGLVGITNMSDWVALGRIVPFIDTFTPTWSVVHNATLTSKIYSAWTLEQFDEPYVQVNNEFGWTGIWKAVTQMVTTNPVLAPTMQTMQKHWSLIEFLGPMNANWMRVKYGDKIWNQIDNTKFGRYQQLASLLSKGSFPSAVSFSLNKFMQSLNLNSMNSTEFGTSQVDVVLSWLYESINTNSTQMFREEEAPIKSVNVIDSEYQVLKKNAYIEIISTEKITSNSTWRVFYRNPSVFNIKKLKASSKISSSLLNNITSYTPAQLRTNFEIRRELNSRLCRELLINLFDTVKNLNIQEPDITSVFQNIQRIKPFKSDNQLIGRVYQRTISFWAGKYNQFNGMLDIIPDVSNYFPFYQYFRTQFEFATAFYELRRIGLSQVSKELFIPNFKVDYFKGWESIQSDFLTMSNTQFPLDANTIKLMEEKQFTLLFDKFVPSWRKAISTNPTIKISPVWWVSQAQIDTFLSKLSPLEGGDQWMYGMVQNVDPFLLDKRGFALPSEISNGATIVSKDVLSNPSYAPYLSRAVLMATYVRNAKVFQITDTKLIADVFQYRLNLNSQDINSFMRVVPILTEQMGSVYYTFNAQYFNKVMVAFRLEEFNIPQMKFNAEYDQSLGAWQFFTGLIQVYNSVESTQVLKHLMLLDFLGPIQANRMRIQHGENIWNVIDTPKFNRFFDITLNYTLAIFHNRTSYDFIGRYGSFSWNPDGIFERNQIELLSFFWTQLTKGDPKSMFREEESWNRGRGENFTVVIVDAELRAMEQNPFLEVKIIEKLSNNTLRVAFQHPNVFNITKFAHLLSPSLASNISSHSNEELNNNNQLRRELTRELTRDLLTSSLKSIPSRPFSSMDVSTFFQNLETIQPFRSDNYLMRKMYERIAAIATSAQYQYNTPLEYIPEMAPLFTPTKFNNNRQQMVSILSAQLLGDVANPQMNIIIQNLFRNKKIDIDYFNGWDSFNVVNTSPLGTVKFDQEGMKWMEKGDFTLLLDRDFPLWRTQL